MRINAVLKPLVLAIALAASSVPAVAQQGAEQQPPPQPQQGEKSSGTMTEISVQDAKDKAEKDAPKKDAQAAPKTTTAPVSEAPKSVQPAKPAANSGVPIEVQAGRSEQLSEEEAAIVPYYNNYLKD